MYAHIAKNFISNIRSLIFSTNRNAAKINISVNERYLKILLLLYNLLL